MCKSQTSAYAAIVIYNTYNDKNTNQLPTKGYEIFNINFGGWDIFIKPKWNVVSKVTRRTTLWKGQSTLS